MKASVGISATERAVAEVDSTGDRKEAWRLAHGKSICLLYTLPVVGSHKAIGPTM